MEEKSAPGTLFGNRISPAVQRKALKTRAKYARKYGADDTKPYPLVAQDNVIMGPSLGIKEVFSRDEGEALDYARGVVIGTMRMGYGHYRIGMAAASAAHALGYTPYWLDLLNFDSAGARMIRDIEKWYSLGSRLSQKSRLFNKFVWDPAMGKWYKRLEKNYPIMEAAHVFADVHRALPPDMPFLATHPWNALGAVHAGMTNVINMIPDNYPLGFHLADGALQTVQSPSSYFTFRALKDMGVPGRPTQAIAAEQIALTGHYVDHELVAHIESDCAARLERATQKKPRRLLISIGGSGAQQQLLANIVSHLLPLVRAERAALFINFGDHANAWAFFQRCVPELVREAQRHFEWEDATAFASAALEADVTGIHAFLNKNTFCAVYTTNLLMRVSDILLTKPSELAFYPIPKLLLERVGGHEAWGAVRAAELGDGTVECNSPALACQALDLMVQEEDLLRMYCQSIVKLNQIGVYNGAYRAVKLAIGKEAD